MATPSPASFASSPSRVFLFLSPVFSLYRELTKLYFGRKSFREIPQDRESIVKDVRVDSGTRFSFGFNGQLYLSEISTGGGGGGGVGILNLGSEMRRPIPAMGVKFANPSLDLGLKYHDPLPLV